MGYDFSQINDKEFEALVVDLLSVHFDKRIERFKPGRDGGVDGRFYSDNDKEIIIQSKHYLGTGYSGLISKLKNKEVEKVIELSPEKYVFATSLPLSRENKKEIREIFSPYLKRDDEIFGQEDLNDILSLNPRIEEKYFKLWITSTTVFERILNNAIKGRSQSELERIQENSFKYVQTRNHKDALQILEDKHVVIISGEPGIGKTTLAENLSLFYASQEFEFIDIQESLSEAENVYKTEAKQIFYFDDFLGSNYFEIIENKKDSHIVKFIDRIKKDKTKRFILTSRTNIFNSGMLHSPVFKNYKIEKQEYLITINSFSKLDRAKILYNHIWFSKLSEAYIGELYIDKRYKEIIKHKNFNPRLIEFITDVDRIPIRNSDEYWEYIIKTLNNPIEIWDDCFKRQNNPHVRNLVSLTVFNGGTIREEELRNNYNELIDIKEIGNPSHTKKDFRSMSELAVKSFLNRIKTHRDIKYSLFNPSIADYILKEYSKDLRELKSVYKALSSVKSLIQINSLQRENIISEQDAEALKQYLFDDSSRNRKSYDYQIYISYLVKDEEKNIGQILKLLEKIISEPKPIKEFAKFVALLIEFRDYLSIDKIRFIVELAGHHFLDEIDIKAYADLVDVFEIDDSYIINHFRENTESYLREQLDDIKSDVDLSKYIKDRYVGYDGRLESEEDEMGVRDELRDMAFGLLNDFNSNSIDNLDLDIRWVIDDIDVSQMFDSYYESLRPYEDEGIGRSWNNTDDDIDDLFERT